MRGKNWEKIQALRAIARQNEEYANIYNRVTALEKDFEEAVADLPENLQDLIWEFVMTSVEEEYALLEFAFQHPELAGQ